MKKTIVFVFVVFSIVSFCSSCSRSVTVQEAATRSHRHCHPLR